MKKNGKDNSGATADGFAYLTKRVLVSRAKAAGKVAAAKAMQTMGYVVVAEGGWVVRKNADGSIHRIKRIKAHNAQKKLVFD